MGREGGIRERQRDVSDRFQDGWINSNYGSDGWMDG